MEELRKLWSAHETRPFPPACYGMQVQGVGLRVLHSECGGLILTYAEGSRLGSRQQIHVKELREKVNLAITTLDDPGEKEYFTELRSILDWVISKLPPEGKTV